MIIALTSIIMLFLLMLIGMPIGFVLIVISFLGLWYLGGMTLTLNFLSIIPFASVTQYALTVIPMFLLMGNLIAGAGFGKELFWAARQWFGHSPGGLAQATVAGNAFFGAASGSTVAATATFAKVAIPEMKKYGYDMTLATGCVAAAGTIACMIPPSMQMVLYSMVAEVAISKMLIAGLIPGIISAMIYMLSIWIRCLRNQKLAPSLPKASLKERFRAVKQVWSIVLIIVVVIGGIYSGIVTPTEAAALGAFAALIFGLFAKRFTLRSLIDITVDTALTTGALFMLVVGAFLYSRFISLSQMPKMCLDWVSSQGFHPMLILAGILVVFIILGTFMDPIAMLFIAGPIVVPIAISQGWSLIWFGILIVKTFELGMITPPYGVTLFAAQTAIKSTDYDVSIWTIFRGILPFTLMDVATLALLFIFPSITLFLPSLM